MLHGLAFRGARAAAFCLALLACSGESGPTAPQEPIPPAEPGPPEVPPGDEPGPGPTDPGPPQPSEDIAGAHALVLVNDAGPGQAVTLANPDGSVIGIYRFQETTALGLTAQQTWFLSLRFVDEQESHGIDDEGSFSRHGEGEKDLWFESETYGGGFYGGAVGGMAIIHYDVDSDGQADTYFGFQRLLGPAD